MTTAEGIPLRHEREVTFRQAVLEYDASTDTLGLIRLDILVRHWQRDIDEARNILIADVERLTVRVDQLTGECEGLEKEVREWKDAANMHLDQFHRQFGLREQAEAQRDEAVRLLGQTWGLVPRCPECRPNIAGFENIPIDREPEMCERHAFLASLDVQQNVQPCERVVRSYADESCRALCKRHGCPWPDEKGECPEGAKVG